MAIIHCGFVLPEEFCESRGPSKTRQRVSTGGFWDYFFSLPLLLAKGTKMWVVFRCERPCQFWRTRSTNVPSPSFFPPSGPSFFPRLHRHVTLRGDGWVLEEPCPRAEHSDGLGPLMCPDYLKCQPVFYDYYSFALISAAETSWQLAGFRVKGAGKGGRLCSRPVQEVD